MNRTRLLRYIPALMWAGLIAFLSSLSHVPTLLNLVYGADKVVHAGAFGMLCLLLLFGAGWPRTRLMWWAAACASVYGITDELHQGFVPGRTQDVFDWLADTTGAIGVVLVWRSLAPRLRRRAPWCGA